MIAMVTIVGASDEHRNERTTNDSFDAERAEAFEARFVNALNEGGLLLDLGCGRGTALMRLAVRYPASRFVGYDFSGESIDWATQRAGERGLDNVRFEARFLKRIG